MARVCGDVWSVAGWPSAREWNRSQPGQGATELGFSRPALWQKQHAIDALCFCVGEFQEVLSQVATQVPEWDTSEPGKKVKVTAADNVLVNGVLTNGAVASVHVSTVPWHGSGWRMEVYGREGSIVASSHEMVQYAQIRLQGGLGPDSSLADLPIPERLTWIPGEVPQGAPFNVAQMFRRLGQGILEGNAVEPDFDLAVKRHQLLDIIQSS